ncbi:MAG: hypothetical protein MUP57_04585 [Clostridia bacterium]|nr:hypothetical protein [Clostridia bacterium]
MLIGGITILPNKYKLTILMIVGAVVLSIFLFANTDFLGMVGEEEADAVGWTETVDSEETVENAESKFMPTDDPFIAFRLARSDEVPIVLEFYARW